VALPEYSGRGKHPTRLQASFAPIKVSTIAADDSIPWERVILGEGAKGLSASVITRLKEGWLEEHKQWSSRTLEDKEYVYLWADGIYANVRLDDERSCLLVLIGATREGKKELVAVRV